MKAFSFSQSATATVTLLRRCLRWALTTAAVALLLLASPVMAQDSYPAYPIQLVVPFAAGGEFDAIARIIASQLTKIIGGSVVVLNKPGAGGMIGGAFVAKARPDGYTLLLGGPGTLAIDPNLFSSVPYDPATSFAPVSYIGGTAYFLVAQPGVARNLQDLIAKAKASPGRLTYSSPGVGSNLNLTMELFKLKTGTNIIHIPYPGTGPAIVDVLAGRVKMTFAPEVVVPYIRSGRLMALAVSTDDRSTLLPAIPTLKEGGVSGADSSGWYGILAPAGTPKPVIGKLNAALDQMLQSPEFLKQASNLGLEVAGGPPEALAQKMAQEDSKWKSVIKASGIKPD